MKNIKYILILVIPIIMFTACEHRKEVKFLAETSEYGVKIIERVIKCYDKADSISYVSKLQKDLIDVLSNPEQATMSLPDNNMYDLTAQIDSGKKSFMLILNIYRKLQVTMRHNHKIMPKHAKNLCKEYVKAINEIYTGEEIEQDSVELIKLRKKTKTYLHYAVIHKITEKYIEKWENDSKEWKNLINQMYNDYYDFIQNTPIKAYNSAKIAELMNEPYIDNERIVNLYRLKLRNEAFKNKEDLIAEIETISLAFSLLNHINEELTKKDGVILDSDNHLYELQQIIK